MFSYKSLSELPLNGDSPKVISYIIIPKAQTSDLELYNYPISNCGDLYNGVPDLVYINSLSTSIRNFANPKSASLHLPPYINMFSILMSL